MNHGTPSATAAQRDRFERLREIGCIVCRVFLQRYSAPDVSHLLDTGRRSGHDNTIPECPWHHRDVVPFGFSRRVARSILGPNREKEPEAYHRRFGSDAELLEMTRDVDVTIAKLKGRPFKTASKQSQEISPREWTLIGIYAVKTRQMSIAAKVADQIEKLADGATGPIDGCEWMTIDEFEQRTGK